MIELKTLKLEKIDYNNKNHLEFLRNLMNSKDINYLWDLSNELLVTNQNQEKYLVLNELYEIIGYINCSDPVSAMYGNTLSIYYAIDEKYRGREYGKKLIQQTSEWLFNEKGIDCIVAQVDTENIHSIMTLTKAGMIEVNRDDEYATFIQRKNR